MASENVPSRGTERMVVMSRDGLGDPRTVVVPVSELRGVRWTPVRGGDGEKLSRPTIGASVDATLYPMEWRSGQHPAAGDVLFLLAEPEDNDRATYAELYAQAATASSPRARDFRRRCEKAFPNQRARAVLEFLDLVQKEIVERPGFDPRSVTT